MEYKIPDNIPEKIKTLCAKKDLSNRYEQDDVKKEIKKYLKWYLSLCGGKNSYADVTGIIRNDFKVKGAENNYSFDRDIGGRMQRTRDYTMIEVINESGVKEVHVIAADRDWWVKYGFWVSFGFIVLAFVLGLFGEPLRNAILTKPTNLDTVSVKVLQLPQLLQPLQGHQNGLLPIPEPVKTDSTKHK